MYQLNGIKMECTELKTLRINVVNLPNAKLNMLYDVTLFIC